MADEEFAMMTWQDAVFSDEASITEELALSMSRSSVRPSILTDELPEVLSVMDLYPPDRFMAEEPVL